MILTLLYIISRRYMMVHNMRKTSKLVTFTLCFMMMSELYSSVIVALQTTASTLFSTAEVNAGCSGTLQCPDVAVTRSTEAWTNVHGDQ